MLKPRLLLNNPDAASGQIFHSCSPRMYRAAIAQCVSDLYTLTHTHTVYTHAHNRCYGGCFPKRPCSIMQRPADLTVKNINEPFSRTSVCFTLCCALQQFFTTKVQDHVSLWRLRQLPVCPSHVNVQTT